jgi:ribosomal protein L11 methyltransferase
LKVDLPESLEEEVAGYLQSLGALGSEARPLGGGRVRLEVSYGAAEAARSGRRVLEAYLEARACPAAIRSERRAEQPWVERYESSRRPLDLPGGFRILPRPPADLSGLPARTLVVPAGRAFGTGEHPTTRLVFAAMLRELRPGRPLLDLGTGSGLLALAAARLGAAPVLGLDSDPEALRVARENRRLNGLEGSLWLATGRVEALSGAPYDLVLANLFRRPLEEVADAVGARQHAGGRCVLSGFGPADAEGLAAVWRRAGYRVSSESREGEWAALTLLREERA